MNTVSPIRDKGKLNRMKDEAAKMGREPYMLVLLGLNTGLRISDLLTLRVRDVRTLDYIRRREKKTGKETKITMNPQALAVVRLQIPPEWGDDRLLFQSSQTYDGEHPITRSTAYKWINTACRRAGITEPVGCHTLRKTFGYHHYQKNRDPVKLMMHFNHSEQRITLRYIGITEDQINNSLRDFYL